MAAVGYQLSLLKILRVNCIEIKVFFADLRLSSNLRYYHSQKTNDPTCQRNPGDITCKLSPCRTPNFGLLFDIDGVIVRGRKVLPYAVKAFQKLVDEEGQFRVPTIFVTNAGNSMRHQKAQQLTNWLGVEITEDQVVMSHSPLRMFKQFHDKHCLISGQGPIIDIAHGLGFTRVTTVDQLRNSFPTLDAVDHKRRLALPCAFERYFPRIEAVVLFGEPVRWETSLQLIIDVLMTNGLPCDSPPSIPYPHLPVLACNMDLQWMAEACIARFGHGAFLVCLENLYKKITGKDIIYTALVGKPSEITYHHAEYCVQQQGKKLGLGNSVRRLYAIGDNINTDIYGANLYNRYVQKRAKLRRKEKQTLAAHISGGGLGTRTVHSSVGSRVDIIRDTEMNLEINEGVVNCQSVLVHTGVYNEDFQDDDCDHSPRDFLPAEVSLKEPTHRVENVLSAVEMIFEREGFV